MIKKNLLTISLALTLSPILTLAATLTTSTPTTTTTTNSTGTTTPTEVVLDPNAATNFATWFETHPTTTVDPIPATTANQPATDPVSTTTSSTANTPTTAIPPKTVNTTTPTKTTTPSRQPSTTVNNPIQPVVEEVIPEEPNCPSPANPLQSSPCPESTTIIPFISPLVMGGSAAGLLLFWLIFHFFNRLQLQSLDNSLTKRSVLQNQNRSQALKQENQINFLQTAAQALGKTSPEQQKALQKQISLMEINGNDQVQIDTAKNLLSSLEQKDSKTTKKLLSELTFLFKH